MVAPVLKGLWGPVMWTSSKSTKGGADAKDEGGARYPERGETSKSSSGTSLRRDQGKSGFKFMHAVYATVMCLQKKACFPGFHILASLGTRSPASLTRLALA